MGEPVVILDYKIPEGERWSYFSRFQWGEMRGWRALRELPKEFNVPSQNLCTQAYRLQSQSHNRNAELPAFKTLLPNSLLRLAYKARLRPRSELNPVVALRHLTSGRHLTAQNEISHHSRKECLASWLILDNNTKGGERKRRVERERKRRHIHRRTHIYS